MTGQDIIAEVIEITGCKPEAIHNAGHSADTRSQSDPRSVVLNPPDLEIHAEAPGPVVALKTDPERASTYTDGDIGAIVAQMTSGASDHAQQRRAAITAFLDRYWGSAATARTLIFNAGVGDDALFFASACRKAYYYDESSTVSAFATQRFIHRGAAVTCVTDLANYASAFDAVVALGERWQGSDLSSRLDQLTALIKCGGALFLAEPDGGAPGELHALMAARGCQPVADLDGHVQVYVKGPTVTVIVPIYNAADHVSQLLESIARTSAGYPIRWMFVNDASPDERIMSLLTEAEQRLPNRCLVVDQAENKGFLQTCNAAMAAAGNDDVVLLNSDTIVYDGWARKLVEAAGSDHQIGTVTPLSNNATIYSCFEHINPQNNLNATLAQAEAPLQTIPVGVGFCLYIKRQALEDVGMFDPIFGMGYGEETDLCLRIASAGYRNVLTPQAFVYHSGSASMVAANIVSAGETTVEAHERIVQERYPTFVPSVQEYVDAGITRKLEEQLSREYIATEATLRPSIAIVAHENVFDGSVGGTQFHIRDMMCDLECDFVFYTIAPNGAEVSITGYVEGVTYEVNPLTTDFASLLNDLNPSLIHIHHLMHLPHAMFEALVDWRGQKFFTIHDYFAVCAQHNLLNDRGVYCGVPGEAECNRCARVLFNTGYSAIVERRRMYQRLIDSVSLVVSPSEAALSVFRQGISVPREKTLVVPHPALAHAQLHRHLRLFAPSAPLKPAATAQSTAETNGADQRPARPASARSSGVKVSRHKRAETRLRVGFIGYNSPEKGTALLRGVMAACASDPIQFVAIGEIGTIAAGSENLTATGKYTRDEIGKRLSEHKVDIVIIGSPWPETFSYTVSEVWMERTPVLVGPLGAPAERVRATGAGLILPDYAVATFVRALRSLMNDPAQVQRLKDAAAQVTLRQDYAQYAQLFRKQSANIPSRGALFAVPPLAQDISQAAIVNSEIPIIARLVRIRKKAIPIGSLRERVYFGLHNLVSRSYSDGRAH